MWYARYKRLNAARFTHENSGNRLNLASPYALRYGADLDIAGIEGKYGAQHEWTVIGYTESPPFPSRSGESVAIMFEHTDDFENVWWHYPKN